MDGVLGSGSHNRPFYNPRPESDRGADAYRSGRDHRHATGVANTSAAGAIALPALPPGNAFHIAIFHAPRQTQAPGALSERQPLIQRMLDPTPTTLLILNPPSRRDRRPPHVLYFCFWTELAVDFGGIEEFRFPRANCSRQVPFYTAMDAACALYPAGPARRSGPTVVGAERRAAPAVFFDSKAPVIPNRPEPVFGCHQDRSCPFN
mgnify:CR=1 FL=1